MNILRIAVRFALAALLAAPVAGLSFDAAAQDGGKLGKRVRDQIRAQRGAARANSGSGELATETRTIFIVGGEPTTIERHPWQVALLVKGPDGPQLCGGSQISGRWVLTAAHCFFGLDSPLARVRSGVTELHDLTTTVSMRDVFVHPEYDPVSFRNDIALVRTSRPLVGNVIRLPDRSYEVEVGTPLEVTGWGATAEAGQGSAVLMRAEVPLVSNDECNAPDVYNGAIHGGMICAGRADGGVDACQGDSGGPLVDHSRGAPVLVGVVSWGEGCARAGRYGVYTKVALYEQWIKDVILTEEQ